MGFSVQWPRPTSLEQRVSYARKAATDMNMVPSFKVAVDLMNDPFNNTFKAWPQGIYGTRAGQLIYSSDSDSRNQHEAAYDVRHLFDFWRSL